MSTKKGISYFPSQKRPTSRKTEAWMKECVDAGVGLTERNTEDGVRTSRLNKQINRDLSNGIVDIMDMYKITNPFSIDGFDRELQDYPLSRPRVNLLVGEESLRNFEPQAKVINQDAINEKEEEYKAELLDKLREAILGIGYKEEELKEKLAEIDRWMIYDYQDIRERMANQLIAYYNETLDLDRKFNMGIEHVIVEGEEIYVVDIIAGKKLAVRKVDPLNIHVLRQEPGYKIDDADVIVEDGYHSVGYVIDHYYDELTDAEVSKVEEGAYGKDNPSKAKTLRYSEEDDNTAILDAYVDVDVNGFKGQSMPSIKNRDYSEDGRVRVTRTVWKSLRKVGEISVTDEDGQVTKEYVDEMHKPDKELGETVKWFWINEWWEGHKIGNDIYKKMGPRDIQYRVLSNQSINSSGYVGTSYGISMMDLMRPYQYMYDEFMDRIKQAFAKFKGPMIELDFAKMPDEWEPEKWMHYAENMGYLIIDSFKTGDEGAAQGVLAGNFNTTGKAINPSMGDYIQQHILMLEYIEKQMGIITGINNQRLGNISSTETVGGVERAVRQSNHMTEKMFKLHDHTKLRVISLVLDTAIYLLKGDKVKMQYMLDDVTSKFIEIDGEKLNTIELGISINDASEDAALVQDLKNLAQAGLQNNKINYTQLIDIYTSKGIASMRRKLELAEKESQQREQAQMESQTKAAQAQSEASQAAMNLQLEQAERESIRKAETALAIKEMDMAIQTSSEALKADLEVAKASIAKETAGDKNRLETDKLDEAKRHNMAAESISRIPKTNTSK
jgi:hypothetical protein